VPVSLSVQSLTGNDAAWQLFHPPSVQDLTTALPPEHVR